MNLSLRLANYITRYAPSRARVVAYLHKKHCSNPDELLFSCGYDEEMMLEMWLRTLVARGKSQREIERKLREKQFTNDRVMRAMERHLSVVQDWYGYRDHIQKLIATKYQKHISAQMIRAELCQKYPYFREEITALMAAHSDDASLEYMAKKYRQRYDITNPKERQKFFAALMRRGFRAEAIRSVLSENFDSL